MKKTLLTLTALLLGATAFVQSQSLDEVLKQYFAAIGQDNLLKITSLKSTGKLIQGGIEIPVTQISKRPDFFRMEGTFQGLTFVQMFNGKEGWSINPFTGVSEPQPFNEDQLKAVRLQADINGMIWDWAKKGFTVTLDGKEDVEGTSCYKVRLVTKDNDTFIYFIDSDTFMNIKSTARMKVQGNEVESDSYFSNFMQVEGIAFPGKIEQKVGGQLMSTIVNEKVEINIELDDSIFNKPAK